MSKPKCSRRLWRSQHGRCFYCDVRMQRKLDPDWPVGKAPPGNLATEDHCLPRSRGGRRKDNIVLACKTCNQRKGALSDREFLLAERNWLIKKRGWDEPTSAVEVRP